MFIGHFAVAFALILLFPQVPVWVPLAGVSFPDLLWAILVFAGKEEVVVDKNSPLQKAIEFRKFPYSHSLVITNVVSSVIGGILAAVSGNLVVLSVFVFGSLSHWILDIVVHLRDLPILGFDGDRKLGLRLWRWGSLAFFVELIFYTLLAVAFIPASALLPVLVAGIIFHSINANSYFGFTKKNPFTSSDGYAGAALIGFGALGAIYAFIL